MKRCTPRLLPALCLALLPIGAAAQTQLPLGAITSGMLMGEAVEFVIEIDEPGFLTVVLRGAAAASEVDLVLTVADEDYQALPDGRSDEDNGGNMSAEQVVTRVRWAGTYRVLVESNFGSSRAAFEIGATFLPAEMAGADPDTDARPSQGLELDAGATHEDSIDPGEGDTWDWFAITVQEPGVLTVLTRASGMDEGDLKLEVYRSGDLREPVDSSDQDQNGVLTNESVNIDVQEGETVYVKVMPSFVSAGRVEYRLATGLIPG